MAVIGSLAVNIVAKTDQLINGLLKGRNALAKFTSGMSVLGSSLAGIGIARITASFEGLGSTLHDLSVSTGMSVEKLSFLKYAADQSGASIDSITKAAKELLDKGFDPNNFENVAASIAAIADPVQRAKAAIDIFGKKAALGLLPLINDLPALRQRFDELGGTFTGKMASAADAMGDSFGDAKLAIQGVVNTAMNELAPTIITISNLIAENLGGVREWIDNHQVLVTSIAAVVVGLTAAIPVLYGINTAIGVLTVSMKGLAIASAFLMKNPLIAAIVGVGLLGAAAYKVVAKASEMPAKNTAATAPAAAAAPGTYADPIQAQQLEELRGIRKSSEKPKGNFFQVGTLGMA